jgi:hypothetical protein
VLLSPSSFNIDSCVLLTVALSSGTATDTVKPGCPRLANRRFPLPRRPRQPRLIQLAVCAKQIPSHCYAPSQVDLGRRRSHFWHETVPLFPILLLVACFLLLFSPVSTLFSRCRKPSRTVIGVATIDRTSNLYTTSSPSSSRLPRFPFLNIQLPRTLQALRVGASTLRDCLDAGSKYRAVARRRWSLAVVIFNRFALLSIAVCPFLTRRSTSRQGASLLDEVWSRAAG